MTQEQKDKIRAIVLHEYSNGKIVVSGVEGMQAMPIKDFVEQPAEGILYDLNRSESVVLTFIDDPKWVNDYAVAKTIQELKSLLAAEREKVRRLVEGLEGLIIGHRGSITFGDVQSENKFSAALETAAQLIKEHKTT